jgi:ubiquinone/menaquinone biosynthesis C-methylase UbiE
MASYSNQLAQDYAEKRHNLGVSNKKVLDFGCGDGVYAQEFLNRGAVEVVGIDESRKMIEIANKKYGSLKSVKFQVADGNNLPFDDDTFDVVFANFVLHHFVDALKPFGEIFRVLKKNAHLIATLNAYDIPENLDLPLNMQVPIKLGLGQDTVLVHNTLKPYKQVEKDLKNSNFKIEMYIPIENANAHIDDSYQYKDKVKLMTMLIIAKK